MVTLSYSQEQNPKVDLFGKELIEDFKASDADSRTPLDNWQKLIESSTWRNAPELQSTFAKTSYKKPNYVFNVGGNNYRVLAAVSFLTGRVTVLKVGTHADYDKWGL
jgi:mRNA interferase HigB